MLEYVIYMHTIKTEKTNSLAKIVIISSLTILIALATYFGYQYYSDRQATDQAKQAEISRTTAVKAAAAAKEAKKKEPVYITLPGASKIRAIVSDYTQPDDIWAVVSKTHAVPTDYIPSPLVIPDVSTRIDKSTDERSVRSDIAPALKQMFDQASNYGYQLMVGSGYRSANQQAIYFNSLAASVGEEAANQSIARPGQSEHQTGLAVDISTVSRNCYLDTCFADTSDGKWLAENSYKFGFILRYPEGKETTTGYRYEPWHFRYVGIDLATALHDSGLTLDEAWTYLETAAATLKANGAL